MDEQWIKWEPIAGLVPHYEIDKISDTVEELSILLSQADNHDVKIRVTFTEPVEAYRSTYETFRIKISEKYIKGTFFKVEGSEYLQWLSEQSNDVDNGIKFIHFAITTDDTVLDIIARCEPQVEFVHEEQK